MQASGPNLPGSEPTLYPLSSNFYANVEKMEGIADLVAWCVY